MSGFARDQPQEPYVSCADRWRSAAALFLVRHLHHPRPLLIHAWLWLAATADDIEEKRCCLNAVLQLNPEHQAARAASALLF